MTISGQMMLMDSSAFGSAEGSVPGSWSGGHSVGQSLVFLGSPLITNGFQELTKYGLFVSDLPLSDKSIAMALLAENCRAQNTLREGFEALTVMLEEEKARSEALLHRCLPRGVVERLSAGKDFEATAFKELSIMFTE